jgi:hypothetical protein
MASICRISPSPATFLTFLCPLSAISSRLMSPDPNQKGALTLSNDGKHLFVDNGLTAV